MKNSLRWSRLYKRWYVVAGLALVFTLVTWLLYRIPIFPQLEQKTRDWRFQMNPIPERADTNVVLVTVDDNTLAWTRQQKIPWPFSRDLYGFVIDYFTAAGAAGVIFDLQFNDPDFDRIETLAEQTDGAMAAAIARNGKVTLGTQLVPDTTAIPLALSRFSVPVQGDTLRLRAYQGVLSPIPVFLDSTRAIGIINVEPDADGVIRRVPPLFRLRDKVYPQVALVPLLGQDSLRCQTHSLLLGKTRIPLDDAGNYVANWYGTGGPDGAFHYYSMGAILQSAAQLAQGLPETVPATTFKGKYVIIGATAGGLMDLKTVPNDRIFPGMEIWATLLSNYLQKDFVTSLGLGWTLLIVFLLCLLVGIVFARCEGHWLYLTLIPLLLVVPVVSLLTFHFSRLQFPVIMPLLGFILTYLVTSTMYYFMEGRAKKEIRAVFTRYLSPDVIAELVQDPDRIEMGGEEVNATTLFTDIANFTSISEHFTPRELVTHLNQYFTEFVDLILQNQGLLDKYTGDGLMALFGVPIARPDHALSACRVAAAHRRFCETFPKDENLLTIPQKLHLNTRIGINTAKIVAGNIGSEKRIDYTAIGDGVNLASRLEGVNKVYHTHIIISETTWNDVHEHFVCRELDWLRVKGKAEPTRVFELIGETGVESDWIDTYARGLEKYRAGDWSAAEEFFQQLIDERNDSASLEMRERCRRFENHPPSSWDGILTMETK